MTKDDSKLIKREKLLDEGINLLMTRGYYRMGLKEILDSAQIPKETFYEHFDNKETYAADIIAHYIASFMTQLKEQLDNQKEDSLFALTFYFDALIRLVKQTDFKSGCLLSNLIGEVSGTSEICCLALKSAVDDYRDLLEFGLNQAQLQGSVRIDKSSKRMADLLIDSWQGALLRMKLEKSVEPLERCCDDLLNGYFKISYRR